MVINETVAQNLQTRYLAGDSRALSALYAECRYITEALAKDYAARHECRDSELEDSVQIILSRVLSRYRNPGYKIYSFAKVLNIEVVHELSDHKGPKAQFERSILQGGQESGEGNSWKGNRWKTIEEFPNPEEKEDGRKSIEDDCFDTIRGYEEGSRIILALFVSGSFRKAIYAVSRIAGKAFCFEKARELHYLWRHLKRGKKRRTCELRRGHSSGDKKANQGNQQLSKKGKQAQSKRGGGKDAHHVE